MSGKKCVDEALTNTDQNYRIQVYLPLNDVLKTTISERFRNVDEH